jgi:small-conductance mechanosensitive channel
MTEELDVQQIIQFVRWDQVPTAFFLVVLGWIGFVVLGRTLDNLGERFTDRRLVLKKTKALLRFVLYLALAILVATSLLDIPTQAMFALAGTIGLAVGFAFKDLLASLMAGVILLVALASAVTMARSQRLACARCDWSHWTTTS